MYRHFISTALAVLAAIVVSAPAAAGVPLAGCPAIDTSRPFLPWLDLAQYVPAPGGGMEPGEDPWLLAAGASIVEGNELFMVGGLRDRRSLRLPPGSSATSAPMCVGVEHPTLRLFVRRSGGWRTDALRVEAIFADTTGAQRSLTIANVPGFTAWAPTPPLPIVVGVLPVTPGDAPRIAFRFVAQGTAQWSVDDVYVDPFRTG